MREGKIGRAPDYTAACVVMFGVNLGWVLLLLFAIWGLVGAIFVSLLLNRWIDWLQARKRARAWPPVTD
ncbi:hypothetical protein R5H30_03630 [Sulfitobacter sp. D35]|uniref:hypothetical protein n=1 Tax=Sulfitobacter sp. D35 TaxID=3083252 RepID=UPI00296E759F|nr:hypothetical protein [Sulfitobacter sp. D35]MDW4497060.1 hypothetical protein [Sulfitobacter sp. D35]